MCAASSKSISSNSPARNFNDMRNFNLELGNIDVNPVLNETKTDESYKILIDEYQQELDKSVSLTQIAAVKITGLIKICNNN